MRVPWAAPYPPSMTGSQRVHGAGGDALPSLIGRGASNMARFYDAMIGGKDNFAADRDLARWVAALSPEMPRLFQHNRTFVTRLARDMVDRGITQILDLGCGLPTPLNTHEAARSSDPRTHVVYVDRDPTVVVHGHALLADNAQTEVLSADVRDVGAVLPPGTSLDLSRPVGVLITSMLHHIHDDDDPGGLVRSYMERLPSGSVIGFSHFHVPDRDHPLHRQARDVEGLLLGTLGSGWFRSRAAIAGFFDGLVLEEMRPMPYWIPGRGRPTSLAFCGLARKG